MQCKHRTKFCKPASKNGTHQVFKRLPHNHKRGKAKSERFGNQKSSSSAELNGTVSEVAEQTNEQAATNLAAKSFLKNDLQVIPDVMVMLITIPLTIREFLAMRKVGN